MNIKNMTELSEDELSGVVGGINLPFGDKKGSGKRYGINAGACTLCSQCVSHCPKTAISFNTETMIYEISRMMCDGCGDCVSACPVHAIAEQR